MQNLWLWTYNELTEWMKHCFELVSATFLQLPFYGTFYLWGNSYTEIFLSNGYKKAECNKERWWSHFPLRPVCVCVQELGEPFLMSNSGDLGLRQETAARTEKNIFCSHRVQSLNCWQKMALNLQPSTWLGPGIPRGDQALLPRMGVQEKKQKNPGCKNSWSSAILST